VQFRNSGGVHLADDFYVLVGLVDSSGYSSGIKEKYQAYLLNEVTLEIAGQTLAPPSAARASRICRCGSVGFACRRGRNVGLAWRGRRRCEDANARIKDAKAGRRTILVLINYPSRPNLGSDLAHSILLDLKILRERTRKNLAGSPETRNART